VLHFEPGQKYGLFAKHLSYWAARFDPALPGAHMDTFFDTRESATKVPGGQRIATALLFLNTPPEEGGETAFLNIEAHNDATFSTCARESLAHKPETGDLILFWSLDADGEVNIRATHAACPVVKGEKWSAPVWIHEANYQHPDMGAAAGAGAGGCHDLSKGCRAWALAGECERNAGFMVGQGGQCRASCRDCPPSAAF